MLHNENNNKSQTIKPRRTKYIHFNIEEEIGKEILMEAERLGMVKMRFIEKIFKMYKDRKQDILNY
jgi:hypothetical protein